MADNVLTLIGTAASAEILAEAALDVAKALRGLGAQVDAPDWLAPDAACDLVFDGVDSDQADAAARIVIAASTPIDIIAQPLADRRKRLLVADMELTIIENEMLDELADLLGLKPQVSEITRRAMNDEIDFAGAVRERVALLEGLPESALGEVAARIRLTPGAAALVATMRANGAYAVLVSGGFRFFTRRIAAELGFDEEAANDLLIADGRLTGKVREPILTRESKLATLKTTAAAQGLPLSTALAVGDGANDLPMIEAAGLGVAFHGKPAVAERARHRIDHGNLTALLYAQGYRRGEIVGR